MNRGDKLPELSLPDEAGRRRTLADLAGERGLVLYAYPKDDTPGCTVEAQDFRDRLDELRAKGFAVAGISRDSAASHCSFRDKHELTFPLLTDEDASFLEQIGAYGDKTNYGRTTKGIIRSTVVVAPDGTVLKYYPNVRAKGHAERVAADLDAL
ncbi:MAG TPA: peroxiredoxin [Thermoanaerobaculia bacterium]|nr:peroxiredoxin [Thermoanaerobaculia bacterium]